MKCHWATADDGFRFWLPGCWGGAVNGPHDCSCRLPRPKKEPDPRDQFIKELEHDNARLNRIIRHLLNPRHRRKPSCT